MAVHTSIGDAALPLAFGFLLSAKLITASHSTSNYSSRLCRLCCAIISWRDTAMQKPKSYDWKDSNLALFGSDTEKQVKSKLSNSSCCMVRQKSVLRQKQSFSWGPTCTCTYKPSTVLLAAKFFSLCFRSHEKSMTVWEPACPLAMTVDS